jgi:hypothetical protein
MQCIVQVAAAAGGGAASSCCLLPPRLLAGWEELDVGFGVWLMVEDVSRCDI